MIFGLVAVMLLSLIAECENYCTLGIFVEIIAIQI